MAAKQTNNLNFLITEDWIRNQLKSQKAVLPMSKFKSLVQSSLVELHRKNPLTNNTTNSEQITTNKSSTAITLLQHNMLPHRMYLTALRNVIESDVLTNAKLNNNLTASAIMATIQQTRKLEERELKNEEEGNTQFNISHEGFDKSTTQKKFLWECAFTHKTNNNNLEFRCVYAQDCKYSPWYTVELNYYRFLQALTLLLNLDEYINDLILKAYNFNLEAIPTEVDYFYDEFKEELEKHRKTLNQAASFAYEFMCGL
jgi:hypothetical protein